MGRCHGECGSQKNTGMPSASVISSCSAISLPWSQVSDRRSCAGKLARAATSSVADRLGGVPLAGQVNQDGEPAGPVRPGCRSPTGWSAPVIRSPSQCPASLRPAAAAGRWLIIVMPVSAPARRAFARPAVRLTPPPAGPQRTRGQLAAQPAELRAGRRPGRSSRARHAGRVTGELAAQRLADLLRAPALLPAGQPRTGAAPDQRSACRARAGPAAGRPAAARRTAGTGRCLARRLRRSSLLIVDGLRPTCPAIARTPSPARRRSAMRTRSSSDRYRGEISAYRAPITGG